MAQQIVGSVPEFSSDGSSEGMVPEEVKEAPVDETVEQAKETPEPPAEQPAETTVGEDTRDLPVTDENQDLKKAITGLQEERVKLLKDISELRGQKREIKQDRLEQVQQQIDDLKDVNPQDVEVIEKVIRSKGYITKEESNRMFYDTVKQEELNKFLEKYPEYRPENDPSDVNWASLQRELAYYRTPENPHQIAELLERSHRNVIRTQAPSGTSAPIQVRKRQLETASHGSGGAQRPSTQTASLDPDKRAMLKQGGFTDEDITAMEQRLST